MHKDKKGEIVIKSCELDHNSEGIKCTLKRIECGQYKIIFQPTQGGSHKLHLRKVNDKECEGYHCDIIVFPSALQLDKPVKTIDNLQQPSGVALSENGDIIIVEERLQRVSVYNQSGENIRSFGYFLERPCGVAVSDRNILVTDIYCHYISVYTLDGNFVKPVGSLGKSKLEFNEPMGIGVHPITKKIYVTDYNNHRVQVLDKELNFSMKFGEYGSDFGQFDKPWGVAFDADGFVYVTDGGNHRVQVFKANGNFCRSFGEEGSDEGQLFWPSSVAVDSENQLVYVTEDGNHRISVFRQNGTFLTSFGKYGKEEGDFNLPHGIAVDENGINLYVTDHHNYRLQIFGK